jgi:putative photosynthetic complex assembly protein
MPSFFAHWTAPRFMLTAATGLIGAAMLMAGVASRTDIGATRLTDPAGGRTVDLRFEDTAEGGIRVAAISGTPHAIVLAPGQDGFVRVALRSLARERQAAGHGADLPFRLGQQDDGRLWLRDLATGRLLHLDAYGQGNAQSFARLLEPMRTQP